MIRRAGVDDAGSGSLSLEMILFISGTMNIGNAIERSGASGDEFVVFCSGKPLCDRIVSKFGLEIVKRYDLRLDLSRSGEIALAGTHNPDPPKRCDRSRTWIRIPEGERSTTCPSTMTL